MSAKQLSGGNGAYATVPNNPDQPVRVATTQLPTPTGRRVPGATPIPLGNELERRARQLATGAQQVLTSVQRLTQIPGETRAGVDQLFEGLGNEIQTVRSDVSHAAALEKALPLVILAVGIVVRRPLMGALVALGFYLWQHRTDLPAPMITPAS